MVTVMSMTAVQNCWHICQPNPPPACSHSLNIVVVLLLPQALVDMDSAFAALDVASEQQPPAEPPEPPPDADADADDVVFTGQPFCHH